VALDPFEAGFLGFRFWRRHELGKKLVKKVMPKFAARREAKRKARQAVRGAAGGEFLTNDEDSSMGLIVEVLGSVARTSLPLAIAYLDSLGIHVTGNETTTVALAVLAWVAMQVWSIVRKVRNKPRAE